MLLGSFLLSDLLDEAVARAEGGPVAAYSFNEWEGSVAGDRVGENDGLIEGAEWTWGFYEAGLVFDGEEDCVTVPYTEALALEEDLTFEAWVWPEAGVARAPVISATDYGSPIVQLLGDPAAWYESSNGSGYVEVAAPASLPDETWTHLAMTVEGEEPVLYVDGEPYSGSAGARLPREGALQIGCGGGTSFKGRIDEVRIYSTALSGEEVASDSLTPIPDPPVCWDSEAATEADEPVWVELPCWSSGAVTYELLSEPGHGEVEEFDPETGSFAYLPEAGFTGLDSISFLATNSVGTSAPATYYLEVGAAECPDMSLATEPSADRELALACDGISRNGSFWIEKNPKHGDIEEFDPEAGTLTYSPDPGFSGHDEFTYGKANELHDDTGRVSVVVCSRPTTEVFGGASTEELPGVDLEVIGYPSSPNCEADGESARVEAIRIYIDSELVFSEERDCEGEEGPCWDGNFSRNVQLPAAKVIGEHEISVLVVDQFGHESLATSWKEKTDAAGTVAEVLGKAGDAKGSKGCETPKNRAKDHEYVFKGHVVYGTECADIMGTYPKHGTTVYKAGAGDDIIRAGGEVDTIKAGAGDDQVYGGRGNDTIHGGAGSDHINGGSGDDEIWGEGNGDVLSGTAGSDVIKGGGGKDVIKGGGTADSLLPGGPENVLSFADAITPGFEFGSFISGFPTGREGRGVYLDLEESEIREDSLGRYIRAFNGSTARFGGGVDKIYIDRGTFTTIVGSPFADHLSGSEEPETIDGGGGEDILDGAGGDDTLYGGADDDEIDDSSGQTAGHIHGGPGKDICGEEPDCEPGTTSLTPVSGVIVVGELSPEDPDADGIYVRGTGEGDVITANYEGADVVIRSNGSTAIAEAAPGCEAEEVNPETHLAPRVTCPSTGVQSLVVDGSDGPDTLKASGFPNSVSVSLLGGQGKDTLFGGKTSEDQLFDGPGTYADTLHGRGDDDTLMGTEGHDKLFGEGGSDLLVDGQVCEGDLLDGGSQNDNASWAQLRGSPKGSTGEFDAPTDGVNVSLEDGDVSRVGGASCEHEDKIAHVEFLEGSAGDDILEGDDGPNIILGRSGEDAFNSGGSNDIVLSNNRVPGVKSDPDGSISCGPPEHWAHGEDRANIDPEDKKEVDEDCEIINPHKVPGQARVSGIGSDATAEASESRSDERIIGGEADPEALAPLAFFQLDETSGTTAKNWGGEENAGTYQNGASLDEEGAIEESSGVHLDGVDDKIDLTKEWDPESFEVDDGCKGALMGYTVEIWVKFDAAAAGREELFSRAEGAAGFFLYRAADGRIKLSTRTEWEAPTVTSESAPSAGIWHHVVGELYWKTEPCITFAFAGVATNQPQLRLWVDGAPYVLGTAWSVFPPAMPSAHNLVGARETGSGPVNFLQATVDDVAIYDLALSEDEVFSHLASSEAPEPTTVLVDPEEEEGPDWDEDGVIEWFDNCEEFSNPDQEDGDGDGVGDACQVEADTDEDGIADDEDNCPQTPNPLQEDENGNLVGDVCEPE